MRYYFDNEGNYKGFSTDAIGKILAYFFPVAIIILLVTYPLLVLYKYLNRDDPEENSYPRSWNEYKTVYILGLVVWILIFICAL